MKIFGLQKMTLLDFPGCVACTVFLGGCDFRCPFCHNFELVDGTAKPLMTDEELISFLEKRRGLLDGVAFTGGEPLLSKELPELMRKIRALGFKTKLDTNGYHPSRLRPMLEEGLVDYVAMDVKNS
ncbi:MAG: anaerobic ribonucleoside-triphosphate reductase activating protein, partial [Oscillospiraceae bacterium]|nr:anaerobic ribonucleoside-triphosphate reductase activating protein [Oscillospiraceae bacterium]